MRVAASAPAILSILPSLLMLVLPGGVVQHVLPFSPAWAVAALSNAQQTRAVTVRIITISSCAVCRREM
jgi:hypothetical protein